MTMLLAVSVLAVGVFGFLGMNPDMGHDGGCIASLVNAATCPLQGIESMVYHASAYASFSQAVLASSLVLLALAALALFALARGVAHVPVPIHTYRAERIRHAQPRAPRDEFVRWLSLFENSPSVIRGA